MRTMAPVEVVFYHPTTKAGKEELAKRVAEVHADAVIQRISNLSCPAYQKRKLLDAVIASAREYSDEAQRCLPDPSASRMEQPYKKE